VTSRSIWWSERTSPDLNDFSENDVGLVPVGATEQHGPHLPTGTDTIIAAELCRAVASATGSVILPPITVACSYGHGIELPGTLSFSPEELACVVRQYALWASASNLRRLLFINAHLGNSAGLGAGTDYLRLYRPDLLAGVVNWWSATPELWAEAGADGEDMHANRAETSVMLHIAPELVRRERIVDDVDRTPGLVFRYTAPALSQNGVTRRPSEASAELGQRLFDMATASIIATVTRAQEEEAPLGRAPVPRTLLGGL